jgi:hypothetical protein
MGKLGRRGRLDRRRRADAAWHEIPDAAQSSKQRRNSPNSTASARLGETVRVVDGPFIGFYAKLISLDDNARIRLLLDILDGATEISGLTAAMIEAALREDCLRGAAGLLWPCPRRMRFEASKHIRHHRTSLQTALSHSAKKASLALPRTRPQASSAAFFSGAEHYRNESPRNRFMGVFAAFIARTQAEMAEEHDRARKTSLARGFFLFL